MEHLSAIISFTLLAKPEKSPLQVGEVGPLFGIVSTWRDMFPLLTLPLEIKGLLNIAFRCCRIFGVAVAVRTIVGCLESLA